jgi:iron(II)-dependent oxidoreductase
MTGNVMEWVADWYAPDYYDSSPSTNPPGPAYGRYRMTRGGSFKSDAKKGGALRVSNRYGYTPSAHLDYLGFRCAANAPLGFR